MKSHIRRLPQCAAAAFLLSLLVLLPAAQPISEPPSITLALLGDVMLGRGVAQAHLTRDWDGCLSSIAPYLQSADLALANLESPLAAAQSTPGINVQTGNSAGYNLCAPPGAAQALTSIGLDVLTLANNHTSDCFIGEPQNGALTTASVLASNDLGAVLPGEPLRRSVGDIPITFLAFDDVSSALDPQSVSAAIQSAAADGSLVVVSIHWGSEYHPGPDARQRQLATVMAEAGADLIWGHHPHVLQTVEWLPGGGQGDPGHHDPTLVIYSMGNALFDQVTPPDANRSALLLVTLDAHGVRGVEAVPFSIDPLHGEVAPASNETAQTVLNRLGIP